MYHNVTDIWRNENPDKVTHTGGGGFTKTWFRSVLSCSSSQWDSLVHSSVRSVSGIASVQYLIPSSSHSSFLFICFPPALSFIPMIGEKNRAEHSEDNPKGLGGESWQMQTDEEGQRAMRRDRKEWEKKDIVFPLQHQQTKILILYKRRLKSCLNKEVVLETPLRSLSFAAPF